MVERVQCRADGCERMILPTTAADTDGRCMPCVNAEHAAQREAYIRAHRVVVDRFAGIEDPVEILRLMQDRPPYDPLTQYAPPPKPRWAVYAGLSKADQERMVQRATALLETSVDDSQDVARDLACFTDADLTAWHMAALDRGECYPPQAFRGAVGSVRDRIIERVERGGGALSLNHALLALAWIGDSVVVESFSAWRATPPAWASQLHVPPEAYANSAGWELDPDGRRRELCLSSCWPLVRGDGAGRSAVRAVLPQPGRCPWCDQALVALLTLDLRDPRFAAWEIDGPGVAITTCHVCSAFGVVFCELDERGGARWSERNVRPKYLPKDASTWGGMPVDRLIVSDRPRASHFAADWCSEAPLSQVGGLPSWVQDADHPACPGCHRTMTFLGQVAMSELGEPAEGTYYTFLCTNCRMGATTYQQT